MKLIIPQHYHPLLDLPQTEKAIKLIKDFFQVNLAEALMLRRVTAPIIVLSGTGINDDLNGIERPVSFPVKDLGDRKAEVVQSLAKWKRMVLADYHIGNDYGIYTDMNAIRPDEELDNLHSIYVDQWDWEKVMHEQERNLEYLKKIVRQIYRVIKKTEVFVYQNYPLIDPMLPEEITFIHAEDLYHMFPGKDPRERENLICREHKAVFIIGIGYPLPDGNPHDGRAPDYDDWSTETQPGFHGMNGDILVWNPLLEMAFELSSMGIRVDPPSMRRQLEMTSTTDRLTLMYHKRLLNAEFPQTIGGGIGQSRLCMYFLRKAHIGEVQAAIWPEEMIMECKKSNIILV
jgi:aspartate--ammonia ligase